MRPWHGGQGMRPGLRFAGLGSHLLNATQQAAPSVQPMRRPDQQRSLFVAGPPRPRRTQSARLWRRFQPADVADGWALIGVICARTGLAGGLSRRPIGERAVARPRGRDGPQDGGWVRRDKENSAALGREPGDQLVQLHAIMLTCDFGTWSRPATPPPSPPAASTRPARRTMATTASARTAEHYRHEAEGSDGSGADRRRRAG